MGDASDLGFLDSRVRDDVEEKKYGEQNKLKEGSGSWFS